MGKGAGIDDFLNEVEEGIEEEEEDEDDEEYAHFEAADEEERQAKLKEKSMKGANDDQNGLDISSLTDKEKDLVQRFLENLQVDSVLKNISSELLLRLQQEFKGTEYELVVDNISKKIMKA